MVAATASRGWQRLTPLPRSATAWTWQAGLRKDRNRGRSTTMPAGGGDASTVADAREEVDQLV